MGNYRTSFIMYGKSKQNVLWHFSTWKKCKVYIEHLLGEHFSTPTVRTDQFIFTPMMKQLKFGKIGWNDKSDKKWCWYSPTYPYDEKEVTFGSTVIKPLSRELQSRMPFFFEIENCALTIIPEPDKYNQSLFFSLSNEILTQNKEVVMESVKKIYTLIDGVLLLKTNNDWCEDMFCLDVISTNISYPNMGMDLVPDIDKLDQKVHAYNLEKVDINSLDTVLK